MSMSRRDFMTVLAAASASSLALGLDALAQERGFYDVPKIGNVHLLHMTDCHAQLLPVYFREPSVNLGLGEQFGKLPHLVGEALLKAANIKRGSAQSHAFTYLDFEIAAARYGKVGGFAHLATLVKMMRAQRPNSLPLTPLSNGLVSA